jgi:hypothetical protein
MKSASASASASSTATPSSGEQNRSRFSKNETVTFFSVGNVIAVFV